MLSTRLSPGYFPSSLLLSLAASGLLTSGACLLARLKWASIFAIVAVLSCPLSPKPFYSLALAFKLCVIVLTLCAMGEAIEDEAGVSKLFTGLFWGTLIVVTADVLAPF